MGSEGSKRPDLGSETPYLRSERLDLGSGLPDVGSESTTLESERSDLESERPYLGSERPILRLRGTYVGRKPEKIALCGIIGHRPLRGCCPKKDCVESLAKQ